MTEVTKPLKFFFRKTGIKGILGTDRRGVQVESLNIPGQTISNMDSGYIATDVSWIPVAGSSVYIYSIPLPFTISRLLNQSFWPYVPIPWLAYLSSLKLLLLKPPNTPFRSLPTTQNTSNTIIISPISLTFIVLTIIKIQNNNRKTNIRS